MKTYILSSPLVLSLLAATQQATADVLSGWAFLADTQGTICDSGSTFSTYIATGNETTFPCTVLPAPSEGLTYDNFQWFGNEACETADGGCGIWRSALYVFSDAACETWTYDALEDWCGAIPGIAETGGSYQVYQYNPRV